MRKLIIISCVFIFLVVTAIIFKMDVPSEKAVTFSAKKFNIQNKNTGIKMDDIDAKLSSTNINNKNFVNLEDINFKTQNNYKPLRDKPNVKNPSVKTKKYVNEQNKNNIDRDYSLTISWNQWRSNIVNKILDDSYSIPQLNDYDSGTWFYYSFEVDNEGNINNVKVMSFTLETQDIQAVENLIRSYSHTRLVVFPNHSKRKKVSIRAICLFDKEPEGTESSDFHDLEHVKF